VRVRALSLSQISRITRVTLRDGIQSSVPMSLSRNPWINHCNIICSRLERESIGVVFLMGWKTGGSLPVAAPDEQSPCQIAQP